MSQYIVQIHIRIRIPQETDSGNPHLMDTGMDFIWICHIPTSHKNQEIKLNDTIPLLTKLKSNGH